MTSWQKLRDEAASCTRCDLYQRATQTVFGEGRTGASIALIGEQPGDQEADLVAAREAAAEAAAR